MEQSSAFFLFSEQNKRVGAIGFGVLDLRLFELASGERLVNL
jgi:hypothetical protein